MELDNQNFDSLQVASLNDAQSQNNKLMTPAKPNMTIKSSFEDLSDAVVGNATRTAVKDTERRRNSFNE